MEIAVKFSEKEFATIHRALQIGAIHEQESEQAVVEMIELQRKIGVLIHLQK